MSDNYWKCINIPWPSKRPAVRAQTLMSSLAADIGKVSLSFGDMQQTAVAWPLKKVVYTYNYTWRQHGCEVKGSEHVASTLLISTDASIPFLHPKRNPLEFFSHARERTGE